MTHIVKLWHARACCALLAVVVQSLLLSACSPEASPAPVPPAWQTPGHGLAAALLSVHGTSATDVWVAGADGGTTGNVLHWDGAAWARVETHSEYPMWWVHAFAPDDVFVAGGGATILHWDGQTFTRQKTPGVASNTVYGLWGATPTDVWAVGSTAGHAAFLWHYDGKVWAPQELPDEIALADGVLPGLFKVWGRSATDVWAVGSRGLMLHYDGAKWSVLPTQTSEILFTVSGSASEVVAVGGSAKCVILDAAGKSVGPAQVPMLQGVDVASDGTVWACGEGGAVYQRKSGAWEAVDMAVDTTTQSLHAIWADPDGGVWTVGGNVLTAALSGGVLYYRGPQTLAPIPALPKPGAAATTCPADRVDLAPTASIARRWNELMIDSIRRDVPRPGVHARNLFHVSMAMHDAWAAFEPKRKGMVSTEKATGAATQADRNTAISYAAFRVLHHRYAKAVGGVVSADCYRKFMAVLGQDPDNTGLTGAGPASLGNRVGQAIIDAYAQDGANEANNYADVTGYKPTNPSLIVDTPGTPVTDPDIWQELNLAVAATQNGLIIDSGTQKYIGSNWGFVKGFAVPAADARGVVHDSPEVPKLANPMTKTALGDIIRKTAFLDYTDGQKMDISPGAYGNNPLGSNDGKGHSLNPVTGKPYAPNPVLRGDFGRVLAEFWADGPKSETPPGHWFVLANTVSDATESSGTPLKPFGAAATVDRLTWDVQMYLALGGAVHDAAIVAWGLKRAYLGARPITLVRYAAAKGQSSDPAKPSYDPNGLLLEDGYVELITEASSAPGQRHHHLRWWKGQVAVRAWLGEPGDRKNENGPIAWIRGVEWLPYQRRTFVTPAFPGFVSGHSTFSRAAAEVLASYTGSEYFPGGLGEFSTSAGNYLVFENGPSADLTLQWATYFDAADQAGQSRVYGGIHIFQDDWVGRKLGSQVGLEAVAKAKTLFTESP